MASRVAGAFRLFEAFGITVHLHWTWFLLLALQVHWAMNRDGLFDHPGWHIGLFLGIFAIVTLHEFGHALACRSVGGFADTIVLWPLGGVAFGRPPDRPGPILWWVAAGPLVNVALVPLTLVPLAIVGGGEVPGAGSDLQTFVYAVAFVNVVLLVFNMLPIYPLDGGQVLQAVLWFFLGKAKSLTIVAYIGMGGAVLIGLYALSRGEIILLLIAAFVGWQAYHGLKLARAIV